MVEPLAELIVEIVKWVYTIAIFGWILNPLLDVMIFVLVLWIVIRLLRGIR